MGAAQPGRRIHFPGRPFWRDCAWKTAVIPFCKVGFAYKSFRGLLLVDVELSNTPGLFSYGVTMVIFKVRELDVCRPARRESPRDEWLKKLLGRPRIVLD
jgi:hypothetical protein